VIDEKRWRLPIEDVDDARVPALATYLPADYRISRTMARTLAVYVERRSMMSPARRREVARHLIDPILDQIGFRAEIDPDLMMYTLYYQAFLRPNADQYDNQTAVDLSALQGHSPLRRTAVDGSMQRAMNESENPEVSQAPQVASDSFLSMAASSSNDAASNDAASNDAGEVS